MMQVGIVTPRYPPNIDGGGEIEVELLAQQLQKADRISGVTVLSFDGKKTDERDGITVERLASLSSLLTETQNLLALRHLRHHVDRFDIVHAYNMELHPVVGSLTGGGSPKAVGSLNSYHFFNRAVTNVSPGPLERLYESVGYPTTGRVLRYYMRQLDHFIAISETVKQIYTDHGFDADSIDVIPSFLDPSFSVPNDVDSPDTFRLLYVGSLIKAKGVDNLVRALTQLSGEYHLSIVGDGPQAETLRQLACCLNVQDRVTFQGHIEFTQLKEEYAKADLFVHPGVWPEPFGRTILEAMQAGLAVVCTNIGGPSETVPDTELQCPPRDPTALAETIQRARKNAPEIGRRNQEYVYEKYSPDAVVPKIVDLYAQM